MDTEQKLKRLRSGWEILTICVFLGLLWMPTIDSFLKLDRAPMPVEHRRLHPWPALKGIAASREYIAGIEGYFDDHFGFRNRLIAWNNRWKHELFNEVFNDNVAIGRDGWLFFLGQRMLDNWRGEHWTPEQLMAWKRLLEMRRDWLEAQGCKYIFVVPPDKHTVYPEHLPEWIGKRGLPTKLQQLVSYMKAHSTVKVLDLTQPLIKAKRLRVDYLKTDTHWNQFGAFVGYQALIRALAPQFHGLRAVPATAYKWKPIQVPPCDLPTLLGQQDAFTETEAFRAEPVGPFPKLVPHYDPVRFGSRPHQAREELMAGTQICYTLNERASGKVIVFRDSFAGGWVQFLGQNFREVIYVWHYDWDRPLIAREKPDLVIDEMLERFFNVADPVELAGEDLASSNNTCVTLSSALPSAAASPPVSASR